MQIYPNIIKNRNRKNISEAFDKNNLKLPLMFIILRLIKLIQKLVEQHNLCIKMSLKVKDFNSLLFLPNIQLNLLEKPEEQHNLLEKPSNLMASSHNL